MQGVQPLIWDNRHFLYSGQEQDMIENVWTHTLPIVNSILIRITAVTRGHFLGWSTDQEFHYLSFDLVNSFYENCNISKNYKC